MLFNKFAEITRATIKGNLVVAAIQGALGGLIFWFLGIPAAVLWGVVMAVLSLIPAVGASLIWVPVALYLYAVGEIVDAVILTAFGAIVIGLVDNIVRPFLVGRDTKLPIIWCCSPSGAGAVRHHRFRAGAAAGGPVRRLLANLHPGIQRGTGARLTGPYLKERTRRTT